MVISAFMVLCFVVSPFKTAQVPPSSHFPHSIGNNVFPSLFSRIFSWGRQFNLISPLSLLRDNYSFKIPVNLIFEMLSLYLYSHKQYIIEFQACITHIQISFSLNRSSEANPMTLFPQYKFNVLCFCEQLCVLLICVSEVISLALDWESLSFLTFPDGQLCVKSSSQ